MEAQQHNPHILAVS